MPDAEKTAAKSAPASAQTDPADIETAALAAQDPSLVIAAVQPRSSKTLDKMRGNPKADWTIADIEKVCRELDINCTAPSHGSHYKVSST
ncbi:MAG: hypothetical protein J0H20_09385, partial [Rhizobiales bacterium]|nr:hypothetical protein [Hyphomicrobiales bacterium]